ncbi:tyrosine-protein phosphatase non-receptor type 9 isoform X2 [Bacillus rossius redtenbacheri]|uniref:tyrosine-protein phosphatase non-receptor type 9 isoform X2 n=1 Tax=Bacillus rossius redtenbacheri TaxID=93214 RepID=UPI002FDEE851
MAGTLTADQEQATKQFIDIVNRLRRRRSAGPVSWGTAIKFLAARKFDVGRAVALYEQHESTRRREGLVTFDPSTEPLKSELDTGKFTILPTRDASGAAIAVFTARMHSSQVSSHQTTLQGVVYQLDVALESVDTQRSGLVFIYDMSDSKYSNFDYDLSQKILTLLKGGYPAKLKKVLIVTAPLWFKAPFKILRLFVREKLRDRVFTVSIPQLTVHIPRSSLPTHLGGTLDIDHAAWLLHCVKSMTNRYGDLCDVTSSTHPLPATIIDHKSALTNGGSVHSDEKTCDKEELMSSNAEDETRKAADGRARHSPAFVAEEEEDDDLEITSSRDTDNGDAWQHSSGACSPAPPASSASSGFSDDDSLHCDISQGCSLEQFVESVRARGRAGLVQEYAEIRARVPDGSFNHARLRANQPKNRYTDVLCYDHSRILLSQIDGDPCSDYINANFVDGYKQKNAFISTQGPLPKTTSDFWRMVWEQQVLVVVMTTRAVERGRTKCAQYWEEEEGGVATHGSFQVTTGSVEQHPDYTVSSLRITNLKTQESREVSHFQFTSWPDYGVPHSALAMLDFLERVRQQQSSLVAKLGDTWAGHPRGPPIVVHCSAGIGRTGTFCTLDICISRLEDVGTVDVRSTVERIRAQRAYSIQMPDQYVFCHLALIEYALSKGLITEPDLAGFDNSLSDESD